MFLSVTTYGTGKGSFFFADPSAPPFSAVNEKSPAAGGTLF